MHFPKRQLNIAQLCPSTEALGPGKRFAFWVQGCPFDCPGCIAPDWIPFRKATPIAADKLADRIIRQKGIEGISISGGEPFMQAGRILEVLRKVKRERPELNSIIFTGFTLKQLQWKEALQLLEYTDLLVAGPYVESRNDKLGLRGSSNQQLYFLTKALIDHKDDLLGERSRIEFHVLDDSVLMVGIPDKNFHWKI